MKMAYEQIDTELVNALLGNGQPSDSSTVNNISYTVEGD
jgi:hypothetical protein